MSKLRFPASLMTVETDERPLATLTVTSYNHERFIREAVESALAQTYSPLEIILSDDCSTDSSFQIMQRLAARYQGPHTVTLNRNPRNLGIGAHVNQWFSLASGDLVLGNAGDDISDPERVASVVKHWLANGKPFAVAHAFREIDENGSPTRTYRSDWYRLKEFDTVIAAATGLQLYLNPRKEHTVFFPGAVLSYRKEVYSAFGPFDPQVPFEDHVLLYRAFLSGTLAYLGQSLLSYRAHPGSVSFWPASADMLQFIAIQQELGKQWRLWSSLRRQQLADTRVRSEKGHMNAGMLLQIETALRNLEHIATLKAQWWDLSACERVRALARLTMRRHGTAHSAWFAKRLLPLGATARLWAMKTALANLAK